MERECKRKLLQLIQKRKRRSVELLLQTTETSYIDLNLDPGTVCSYQITSVSENTGLESARTGVLRCASRPTAASGVAISEGTAESISITWEENNTATGYLIYRKKGSGSYVYLASTTSLSYTDTGLDSGTNYRYKLLTYTDTANHPALSYSNEAKTSTLPAKLTVMGKAGFGKVRLSWTATTGAQGIITYISLLTAIISSLTPLRENQMFQRHMKT